VCVTHHYNPGGTGKIACIRPSGGMHRLEASGPSWPRAAPRRAATCARAAALANRRPTTQLVVCPLRAGSAQPGGAARAAPQKGCLRRCAVRACQRRFCRGFCAGPCTLTGTTVRAGRAARRTRGGGARLRCGLPCGHPTVPACGRGPPLVELIQAIFPVPPGL
jgi:hypothetical protein